MSHIKNLYSGGKVKNDFQKNKQKAKKSGFPRKANVFRILSFSIEEIPTILFLLFQVS